MSFLQGAMTRDTTRIVSAMKEMGFISRRADPEVFDRVVQYFHDKLRGQVSLQGFSLKDIKFEADKTLASLLDLREMNVSLARAARRVPHPQGVDPARADAAAAAGRLHDAGSGDEPDRGDRALPRALPAGREEAVVGGGASRPRARWRWRRCRCPATCSASSTARCAAISSCAFATSRTTRACCTYGGQQILWGMLTAASAALAVLFDGRGHDRASWAAGIASAVFALFLLLAWLAGRPRRVRRRP